MKTPNYFTKKGYSVNIEYCGQWHKKPVKNLKQGQMYVLRLCGEWIGSALTKTDALLLAVFDDDKKTINIL